MIHFAWPWFWLCLPLPWLIYHFAPAVPSQQPDALKVPFFFRIEQLSNDQARQSNLAKFPWLLGLVWLLCVAAVTRPQWLGDSIELPLTGRDLLLAVDLSESMKMQDMQWRGNMVDRLSVVKRLAGPFIEHRTGDRLGLILFGEQAYLQTPLTFDRKTVQTMLEESVIGIAGKRTAIGDAIGLAVKRLRQHPKESRVLILMTDGANTAGEVTPLQAAELATQSNIRIYTIGIGATQMEVQSLFGRRVVNPSQDLDEDTLRAIAEQTNGRYFRATSTEELAAIYELLNDLEPTQADSATFRPMQALYPYPLGLGLLLSVFLALQGLRWSGLAKDKMFATAQPLNDIKGRH